MNAERLIRRLWPIGTVAALAGGAAAIWGYLNAPQSFFGAWLAAFWFWLSMPLGALALLLIWDLTGGRWEPLARLPLTAMAATTPLFVLLFLPLLAGLAQLYPWFNPPAGARLHGHWYLNPAFFFVRLAVYFLIWNGFAAWRLLRAPGSPPRSALSGIGVLLMGYSMTYASIDWLMSTEPPWFSSIYGMVVGAGQFIASLAFALIVIGSAVRAGEGGAERTRPAGTAAPPAADGARSRMAALAAILLAVVIFWGYTSFCQWLIIWEENLRSEIPWFIERWHGPWSGVIYSVAAAHFLVPFLALLWTPAKRNPTLVLAVCALLLVADVVQVWWLVLPGLAAGFSWLDPAVMLGVGGVWLLALAGVLRLRFGAVALTQDATQGLIHG